MYNQPFTVKICGVTRLEDARYISGLMADRIGFIFTPESKRFIEPAKAGAIIEWLGGIEPVGVFMNQSTDTIIRICTQTGIKSVQLHGQESPAQCEELSSYTLIKTISVSKDSTVEELQMVLDSYHSVVDEFLFDTARVMDGVEQIGGTGIPFNWKVLRQLVISKPWILAGGISSVNIKEAWDELKPNGFDLSSRVEFEPGLKDFDLLDELFETFLTLTNES